MQLVINEHFAFRHDGTDFVIRARIWSEHVKAAGEEGEPRDEVQSLVLIDRHPSAFRRHGEPCQATEKIGNLVYRSRSMLNYPRHSFFYIEENRVRDPSAPDGFSYEYHDIKFNIRTPRFLAQPTRRLIPVEYLERTLGTENVQSMSKH